MNSIIKNNKFLYIIFLLSLFACAEEDKPLDAPFVYITDKYNGVSSSMDSQAKYTATYYLRLSSKVLIDNLSVDYEVITGNGLAKDVDYVLVDSTASPLTFQKGTYEKSIQIKWLSHQLDKTKDNSLRIRIKSVSQKNITIGRLGPDKIGSEYIITKQ